MADEVKAYESSEFRLSNRKRLLKGLFWELSDSDKVGVLYTLKEETHMGYPSLSQLYMEENDPTEYRFATKYLESWDHWEKLCECSWFQPYLVKWRKALEMKLKSEALANIIRESRDTKSPSRFTANKFIIDRGWEPKEGQTQRRGRPSKEDVRTAAYDLAAIDKRLEEDLARLSKIN